MAHTLRLEACCPQCDQVSTRVHSYYRRLPHDLPVSEQPVRLLLEVKRFRCLNPLCPRRTFAESLPDLLAPRAQRTNRLQRAQRAVGFALGGQAGARLLHDLHMVTSPDTLLRLIRRWRPPPPETPRVLGVDDWAICKRYSYGTILLDLERHRPVDLIEDRTADVLKSWLQRHPGVEIIARDRSTEYARGATEGAPQAVHVADRWHLIHNLKQMLDRFFAGIHKRLSKLPPLPEGKSSSISSVARLPCSLRDPTRSELIQRQADHERRLACYERVRRLYGEGYKIMQIARELEINPQTARKYAYAEDFPERAQRRPGRSILDPYLSYLEARHEQGCNNALQLWREIREQGYPGTPRQVSKWMHKRRTWHVSRPRGVEPENAHGAVETVCSGATSTKVAMGSEASADLPSAKQLAWLVVREPEKLDPTEQQVLLHIRQDPIVENVCGLAQQFAAMVRQRASAPLEAWLEACGSSGVSSL